MKNSPFAQSTRIDRILVVDDSADNSFLIQAILEEEDYKVDIADSGMAALAKIDEFPPDLILLDVMMPGMDGYEVTRRIRANEKLSFIPILLITAYDQPSVAKGLDTGADDFIRKPVEFDELLARVRSLLRLKHSVDERDHIARQREDFVSRLAHDLRTPLVAADRMMGLFRQGALGELSPDMNDAIITMARSNQNLLQMVNTLLEVYRLEAGRKSFSFAPVNLRELVTEVTQELAPLAADKNLALKLDLEEEPADPAATYVLGDRLELHRVLTNLVGNALKFTDSGYISVGLTSAPATSASTPAWVVITVRDTGTGISAEDQAMLFERFRQGHHRRSGSGLGLYLSRRIIETHQGTVDLESELGKGSTFIVRLPAKQP
uniref:sensor histidine kinase n=1 Tax=Trichocoleus desertorum TaxID=1481672 RepID=UPI0025B54330|nr:HAMP domain-containing sensor histidine kinase [Trichocoleus desertorum]